MRIYKPFVYREDTKKMLLGALILVTTILATNGYPSAPPSENSDAVHQDSIQQEVIFQTPDEQQLIFQPPEEQLVFQAPEQQLIFQAPEQKVNQESINDYLGYIDQKSTTFVQQTEGFTISCTGKNEICTNKNDCINGYIHIDNNAAYSGFGKNQECNVQTEVCCTIAEEFQGTTARTEINHPFVISTQKVESGSVNLGAAEAAAAESTFPVATHVQLGCAAALLCVEEKYCTVDGTISPEPVTLSARQLIYRVPLSSCKNPESGIIGKCCRDPNYVDPWPTGNLPANYSGGFDEQGFPTFLNITRVPLNKTPTKTFKTPTKSVPRPKNPVPIERKPEPTLVPENSVVSSEVLLPPVQNTLQYEYAGNKFDAGVSRQLCGVRNRVPQKSVDSKTVFAEIPWQAMVLHAAERKILCSGALISNQDVLTAANCINSLSPNEVSIKLGEWKLGYEIEQEEPLHYQIFNASYINVHPGYTRGLGEHDLAILHLEKPTTFDYHINPLCIPDTKSLLQQKRPCISTGWGKSILQAHYAGAIMHAVNLDVISSEQCKEQVASSDVRMNNVDGTICAVTKDSRNNVCETDVGGPLACENENGVYELAGIYSQDTGCVATNQVAIFAPLDDKWIKEMMYNPTPGVNYLPVTGLPNSTPKYENSPNPNDYRVSTLTADNQYLPPN